jgi:dihydroorotate dehydrogenase (NAD+) catalytic subunit
MNEIDLSVKIGNLKLKNPVVTASGTFGSGKEYGQLIDLNRLGAVVTKGVTLKSRAGNIPPRTCETPSGMLNSIGLQNSGIEKFLEDDAAFLSSNSIPFVVNVAGETIEEYCEVAKLISEDGRAAAIELNLSCPNVSAGGIQFGIDPRILRSVVDCVRSVTDLPLIVKLSPNVTDITVFAKAAVEAGADALSLINTLLGMSIDWQTRKPKLGNIVGGLSGPAIKPVAVRMIWQARQVVDVPIIGMGGISNIADAAEFMLAGANLIAVGTANFVNPETTVEIIDGLVDYCREYKIGRLQDIVGKVEIKN